MLFRSSDDRRIGALIQQNKDVVDRFATLSETALARNTELTGQVTKYLEQLTKITENSQSLARAVIQSGDKARDDDHKRTLEVIASITGQAVTKKRKSEDKKKAEDEDD